MQSGLRPGEAGLVSLAILIAQIGAPMELGPGMPHQALPIGDVIMRTDKLCYEQGELVNITASGWARVPSIGDFPAIFWAIVNRWGDTVFETSNPADVVWDFSGTLKGMWNQTYRLVNNTPPSGQPVPPGMYSIWFYMIPLPIQGWPYWPPAIVTIGDCDMNMMVLTDKDCYAPSEIVNITFFNAGPSHLHWSGMPPPYAVYDSTGAFVAMPRMVQLLVPITIPPNGTYSRLSWDQTYYIYDIDGKVVPPSRTPVPEGTYTVFAAADSPNGVAGKKRIIIDSDCSSTALTADAGPDQTVYEGGIVHFAGTGGGGSGSGGKWTPRKNIPTPRAGGGSAVLNGEIYYAGGDPSDMVPGPSKIFQKYDPATDTWHDLPDMPEPRVFLGLAAAKGKTYALGGSNGKASRDTTFVFDPATNNWSEVGRMPVALEAFGIATVGGYIYVMGGHSTKTNCTPCDTVYRFDPDTSFYSRRAYMPTARSHFDAATLGDRIYAVGGRPPGSSSLLDVYDPATDSWTTKKSFKPYMERLGVEALGGKLYAFGGTLGFDPAENGTFVYTVPEDNWTAASPMIHPRVDFGSGVVGNCIYAVGGSHGWMTGVPNISEAYCLGGELTFTWDFNAMIDSSGDGNYTNDIDATGSSPTHVYGDNGLFVITLMVRDSGGAIATDTVNITVLNVSPSITYNMVPTDNEADSLTFIAKVIDPGSDDIKISWSGSCRGWSPPRTYPNDPANYPDPLPSPEFNPRNVTDEQNAVCGDNGLYAWSVVATDDDGGWTTLNGSFSVANVPPSYPLTFCPQIVGCDPTRFEGSMTDYWVLAGDAGSDDLAFTWNWGDGAPTESRTYFNDGVGPDPPNSPNGTFPFYAGDNRSHAFGDDGTYLITVATEDDDGGSSPIDASVTILNLPPSLSVPPPRTASVNEGTHIALTATAADPGSDDITFTWKWDYGPIRIESYYNNGIGPDPPNSPGDTFPFTVSDSSIHTYGDDCPCKVSLIVSDDDGGFVTYTTTVNVLNLPPTVVGKVEVRANGSLVLRVAGEKFHDVTAKIYLNDIEKYTATVVRVPGSPDEQAVTMGNITMDLTSNDTWSARLIYTPLDDPINGRVWGATPAWLIFKSKHGAESRIHHTFNARHEDTWIWEVPDLRTLLVGTPLDFAATATDPGSDDLTFTWDWGDGTPATATTHFNDGTGPDPYPTPDGTYPFTASDSRGHSYSLAGTYTVMLTVEDDDGGTSQILLSVHIG